MLSEVKSPLFVLVPPLLILELPDCILIADDEKLSVSVNFGDLEILYVNVPSGDKVIVDFIVFVEQDVPDDDLECILLVFVGEFVCDAEDLVDLVIDTDPLDVLELLIDLVFVTDEDDEAVAEDDLE